MMPAAAQISGAVFAALLLAATLRAQVAESKPTAARSDLRAAVERYLDEREDAAAAKLLTTLLERDDATGESVYAAVRAPATVPVERDQTDLVPYRDQLLQTTVRMPEGYTRAKGAETPVVFDIGGGGSASELRLNGCIVAFVSGYTPPEFSDEGRDAFLKVLRRAAHRFGGASGRLRLTGFSWAGHASFDTALHRPGALRGIVPMGGGPRHVHFRLLKNLSGLEVRSFVGAQDDPELIWNLRETVTLSKAAAFAASLEVDPERGHTLPLAGIERVAAWIPTVPPATPAKSGILLGDGALVEAPCIRLDRIDDTRVRIPVRITSTSTDPNDQRHAVLRACESKVVKITWRIDTAPKTGVVTLTATEELGVRNATLFLREPDFSPGTRAVVRARTKIVFEGTVTADPRSVLEDARRTGNRDHPALRTIPIAF